MFRFRFFYIDYVSLFVDLEREQKLEANASVSLSQNVYIEFKTESNYICAKDW